VAQFDDLIYGAGHHDIFPPAYFMLLGIFTPRNKEQFKALVLPDNQPVLLQ